MKNDLFFACFVKIGYCRLITQVHFFCESLHSIRLLTKNVVIITVFICCQVHTQYLYQIYPNKKKIILENFVPLRRFRV